MSKLSKIIAKNDFIRKGLCSNYWLWFHVLGNAFLAKVLTYFLRPTVNLIVVVSVMVIWEIIEWFWEGTEPYGSTKNWLYDTLGDILLPAIIVLMIIY